MSRLRDLKSHQIDSFECITHMFMLTGAKSINHFAHYQTLVLKRLCSDETISLSSETGSCRTRGEDIDRDIPHSPKIGK